MNNRPYLEEMIDAAKGIFALIRGEKAKLGYFNFSQTGLVGSFIAVLIGLALQEVFSGPGPEGLQVPAWANLLSYTVLYATPFLVAYGFLSIIGQRERILAYMVANNWASFFFTLIIVAIFIFQLLASVGYFVIIILTLIIFLAFSAYHPWLFGAANHHFLCRHDYGGAHGSHVDCEYYVCGGGR